VAPAEFPDASLGVPDPGKVHAQVTTPGYVIELTADGQNYCYHASEERVVAVPDEEGQPSNGRITIEGVEASDAQVIVRGTSTLPDGTCVSTELWADGAPLTWWPAEACAPLLIRLTVAPSTAAISGAFQSFAVRHIQRPGIFPGRCSCWMRHAAGPLVT